MSFPLRTTHLWVIVLVFLLAGVAGLAGSVSGDAGANTATLGQSNESTTLDQQNTTHALSTATAGNSSFFAAPAVQADPSIHEVLPEHLQADEELQVTYTAEPVDPANSTVTLRAIGPDDEIGFEETDIDSGSDIEHTVPRDVLQDLRPGNHDLVLEIEDESGKTETTTETNAFEVGTIVDTDSASFDELSFAGIAGDFVEVSVSLDDVDEAYILFGGDRPAAEPNMLDTPVDVLHVDGSTTFIANTRLIGTDRPSEEVYSPIDGTVTSYAHELGPDAEPDGVFEDVRFENPEGERIAETLKEFRAESTGGVQPGPLEAGRYSLVVGEGPAIVVRDDGIADPLFPFDRANIELTEPEIGEFNVSWLPEGNADQVGYEPDSDDLEELDPGDIDSLLDQAIESNTMAVDDRLLLEIEATGIWGAVVDTVHEGGVDDEQEELLSPAQFGDFFDLPEGIELTIEQQNVARNEPTTEFELFEADTSDVSYFTEPVLGTEILDLERFYIVVDTRIPGGVTEQLEDGDEFDITFSVDGGDDYYDFSDITNSFKPDPFDPADGSQFPYFDGKELREETLSIIDRELAYDRTGSDGRPVVTNATGQTISGTTTLHPESSPIDIIIDQRFPPVTVESEDVTLDANGSFEIETDLSGIEADSDVDIQYRLFEATFDERSLHVLESEDEFAQFEVTELTTDSQLVDEEAVGEVTAEITNTGPLAGNETVSLAIDGTVQENKTLALDVEESETVTFDTASELGPGEHPITVETLTDSESQLLVVEDPSPVFTVANLTAEAPVVEGTLEPVLNMTVANEGLIAGSETVEIAIDNETVTTEDVEIGPGGTEMLVSEGTETEFGDAVEALEPGEYTVTVTTPNETAHTTMVRESVGGTFEITDLSADSPVEVDEPISISLSVEHPGEQATTETIAIQFDGEPVTSESVELEPGETTTVETAHDGSSEPGEYTVTATTATDEEETTVVVEESPADEDEPSEESPPTEEPDDDIFGLALTPGRVLGGTALIGAVYVLGYWV